MVERICYNQEKSNHNINIIKNTRCRDSSASIEVPNMKCLPVKNLSELKQPGTKFGGFDYSQELCNAYEDCWKTWCNVNFLIAGSRDCVRQGFHKKKAVESAWKKTGDDSGLRHVNWTGRNYNRGGNPHKFKKVPVCKSKIVKHMLSNQ